jgi:hypothetical protein
MGEHSPLPFLTLRATPRPPDPYQLGLELAGHVHRALEQAAARFVLKDQVDRLTTAIVLGLGRASAELQPLRWKAYRAIVMGAIDLGTLLDVLHHQGATTAVADLALARQTVRRLIAAIGPLQLGRP